MNQLIRDIFIFRTPFLGVFLFLLQNKYFTYFRCYPECKALPDNRKVLQKLTK
jgi:hypothetical protein